MKRTSYEAPIMQFFSTSYYFLAFSSKHSPQPLVVKCPYLFYCIYFYNSHVHTNDVFSFIGGDSIKVDESLFQDLEELDLDADEVLDGDSS
jgi:hypothetical protein